MNWVVRLSSPPMLPTSWPAGRVQGKAQVEEVGEVWIEIANTGWHKVSTGGHAWSIKRSPPSPSQAGCHYPLRTVQVGLQQGQRAVQQHL